MLYSLFKTYLQYTELAMKLLDPVITTIKNLLSPKHIRYVDPVTYTVTVDKYTEWYSNGKRHKVDGPAVIHEDGHTEWWLNGQHHRTDGPAVIYADGTQLWYLHGQLHRTDGPAMVYPEGSKYWLLNDQLHRTDGPAIEWADGTRQWWVNDIQVDELTALAFKYSQDNQ